MIVKLSKLKSRFSGGLLAQFCMRTSVLCQSHTPIWMSALNGFSLQYMIGEKTHALVLTTRLYA